MPYHKYVFDLEKRRLVGDFEKMYANEDKEGYDPWCCSRLTHLSKLIHYQILNSYNFNRILDFGCSKGAFTHLLKKRNNYVLGLDISPSAIQKAISMYGSECNFAVIKDNDFTPFIDKKFDCTICLEIFSYIDHWQKVIADISTFTEFIYISLDIPPNPIGYVKSHEDLMSEVSKHFEIVEELVSNRERIFILGRTINRKD